VVFNERLISDSEYIADLKLSQLRLIRDGELDWFMLIPKREKIVEWCELEMSDQKVLCEEIDLVSKLLKSEGVDKVNIGSLGNMVPQLHIHIIGRKKSDRAWPNAIWGTSTELEFNSNRVNYWKSKL
jgi:diadenosine tetraphosphate (Ap4A) HIT family hydrolase